MKATKMVPASPPKGECTPSALNAQPPTNAPMMPMMMSPMRPKPVPPMTKDASRPATSPTMIQVMMDMNALRVEERRGVVPAGSGQGNRRAPPPGAWPA
jgi:hypothetical protein